MIIDSASGDIIPNLHALAHEGFAIIKNIDGDATKDLNVADLYYDYLFEMIRSEFESLESVSLLLEKNKIKDCFTLLRTIFEVLLVFWLMVHGKKYRLPRTYTITPKTTQNPREARDLTFEKWIKGKKENDPHYKNIIDIQLVGEDKIGVTYEWEGIYDKEDKEQTGYFIPQYFFVISEHYNPFVRFNADLPSIKVGSLLSDEKIKEQVKRQAIFYSKYIHIDSIIRNLILNNLVSETQEDYIRIHYNFLSNYVHPTKEMFQFTKPSSGFIKSDIPDRIIHEQIWLYICRIQYLFLKILLERIETYNPKAEIEKYQNHMTNLNTATSYFWFIDNEPTPYDVHVSEQTKKMAEKFTGRKHSDLVMYYEDPLRRLHQLKSWL